MRTKTLLCAAALAAGVATSMAQSNVYSLNVVGYVNKSFTDVGNYYLVSNPLDAATNDLNNIIPTAPDGTGIGLWSVGAQDFSPISPAYSTFDHLWHPNVPIAPGQGFFVIPNGPFTNTFVGQVRQGPVTNNLVGGGNYEAIGSTVPLSGGLTNQLAQYPALDGDGIGVWNEPVNDFSGISPAYSTFDNKWHPDFNFNIADGFFLIRNGGPVSYVRSFTVQ